MSWMRGLCFLVMMPVWAQLPDVDLFVVEVSGLEGQLEIGKIRNLTARPGYDNQPCFESDNRILYTSIREDGQADAYRFHIKENRDERLTYTEESEYSPTWMPDGSGFSAVRVEHDGTQRLWAFPTNGNPYMLFRQTKPVGYHCWLNKKRLVMFILGEPHGLYKQTLGEAQAQRIQDNIGRGMARIPASDSVAFIHQKSETEWWVTSYDPNSGALEPLIKTPPQAEDMAWTAGGRLLMAQDGKLLAVTLGQGDWQEVADFSQHFTQISRIAISPSGKRLCLVGVPKP